MRCVVIDAGTNQVLDLVPQPADVSTCTSVLASPGEVTASPFLLSIDDAGLIGLAILGLWALAFGIRQMMRLLWSS